MSDHAEAPTVSCIMIFRDAERFIAESVASVVEQVGDVSWELLLVDDGSTDSSTAKALRWAAADERVRYLEHPGHANRGMSASRNLGIAEARGEYVAFLDSDDVWLPSLLAQRVRILEATPGADAVLGSTWVWHSWTGRRVDRLRDRVQPLPDRPAGVPISPPTLFLDSYLPPWDWTTPAICSLLVRRASLRTIGGFDDAFRSIYEDQVFYVKTFLNLTTVLDDRPLGLYRQHPASACGRAAQAGEWRTDRPNPAHTRFLEWLAGYVREHAGTESEVWRAAQANLSPPDLDERARRRQPGRARLLYRTLRHRYRELRARVGEGRGRQSLTAYWTEQFVGGWSSVIDGSVLVVTDGRGASRPRWVPALDLDRAEVGRLTDSAGTYDWIVVVPEAASEIGIDDLVAACARRLAAGGSVLAFVPGPAVGGRSRASREELVERVQREFPAAVVRAEPFGNRETTRALRRRMPAMLAGVSADHHDVGVEGHTGLSVIHRQDRT